MDPPKSKKEKEIERAYYTGQYIGGLIQKGGEAKGALAALLSGLDASIKIK